MGKYLVIYVNVLGERDRLKRFSDDIRREVNILFDLKKVTRMLNEVPRFNIQNISEYYTDHYNNWGVNWKFGETEDFNSQPNCLSYKFYNKGIIPLDLFFLLIEKYSSLIFDIFIWEPTEDWGYIINGFFGNYTKYTYESLVFRDLSKDEYLVFHYKYDYIYKKSKIIDTIVFKGSRVIYPLKSGLFEKCDFISDHFSIFGDSNEDIVSLGKIQNFLITKNNYEFRPKLVYSDDVSIEIGSDIIDECLRNYIKNEIDQESDLYEKLSVLLTVDGVVKSKNHNFLSI